MRDPLYVGPTRPSLIWGIPFEAWLGSLLITVALFIWTRIFAVAVLGPILLSLSWLICLRDPRGFELLKQWFATKGSSVTRRFWGAVSRGPVRARGNKRKQKRMYK